MLKIKTTMVLTIRTTVKMVAGRLSKLKHKRQPRKNKEKKQIKKIKIKIKIITLKRQPKQTLKVNNKLY